MKNILKVLEEIGYIIICLILGPLWILAGITNIFKPIADEAYSYNFYMGILSIVLGFFIIRFWFKRRKKTDNQNSSIPSKKIGGWLIVWAVGLLVSITILLQNLKVFDTEIFGSDRIDLSTIPSNVISSLNFTYYSLYVILILFTACVVLFFLKKHYFPRAYIICVITIILYNILDYILSYPLIENQLISWKISYLEQSVLQSVGGAIIWIPYLIRSKRVKETFIK